MTSLALMRRNLWSRLLSGGANMRHSRFPSRLRVQRTNLIQLLPRRQISKLSRQNLRIKTQLSLKETSESCMYTAEIFGIHCSHLEFCAFDLYKIPSTQHHHRGLQFMWKDFCRTMPHMLPVCSKMQKLHQEKIRRFSGFEISVNLWTYKRV